MSDVGAGAALMLFGQQLQGMVVHLCRLVGACVSTVTVGTARDGGTAENNNNINWLGWSQ